MFTLHRCNGFSHFFQSGFDIIHLILLSIPDCIVTLLLIHLERSVFKVIHYLFKILLEFNDFTLIYIDHTFLAFLVNQVVNVQNLCLDRVLESFVLITNGIKPVVQSFLQVFIPISLNDHMDLLQQFLKVSHSFIGCRHPLIQNVYQTQRNVLLFLIFVNLVLLCLHYHLQLLSILVKHLMISGNRFDDLR